MRKRLKINDFDSAKIKAAKLTIKKDRLFRARGPNSAAFRTAHERYLDHMGECLASPLSRLDVVSVAVEMLLPFAVTQAEKDAALSSSFDQGLSTIEAYENLTHIPFSMLRASLLSWGLSEDCYRYGIDDDHGIWIIVESTVLSGDHLCTLINLEYTQEIRMRQLVVSLERTEPYFLQLSDDEAAALFLEENPRASTA